MPCPHEKATPSSRAEELFLAASLDGASKTTDQQQSESLESATTARTGGLHHPTPQSGLSRSPDGDGTATSASAAGGGNSTNEPGSGDKGPTSLPDRTSSLMDELVSAIADESRMSTPARRRLRQNMAPGEQGPRQAVIPMLVLVSSALLDYCTYAVCFFAPATCSPAPCSDHITSRPSVTDHRVLCDSHQQVAHGDEQSKPGTAAAAVVPFSKTTASSNT